MPTTPLHTYSNQALTPLYDAARAKLINVKLPVSVTLARGTVLGELTASPGTAKAYNNANADGSEVAKFVLQYDVATDAAGNVSIGGGDWGWTQPTAPVFLSGYFRSTELTGLDAPGVTDLGRIVSGSLADGVLLITGA
jgi:Bacteriophage lambda head decoration protein D